MSDEIPRINCVDMPILAVVVPCYNEEHVIKETARQLLSVIDELKTKSKIKPMSFIYFVDDGSSDSTWDILVELHEEENSIKGLKLSRNVGHQYALLAGLLNLYNKVDCVITIDADLQDDVLVIKDMVNQFSHGYDIVYGVRQERHQDSFFKKYSALFFYKLMQRMEFKRLRINLSVLFPITFGIGFLNLMCLLLP